MSYGRTSIGARLPVMFTCESCGECVTLTLDIGKDYIFEETIREAAYRMSKICGWDNGFCLECKDALDEER